MPLDVVRRVKNPII